MCKHYLFTGLVLTVLLSACNQSAHIEPEQESTSSSVIDRSYNKMPLSEEGLHALLGTMHLQSFTVPPEFGQTMLNVDWEGEVDMEGMAAGKKPGRKISLGFSNLINSYHPWGRVYIEYSTYDFVLGTEYDTFATPEDRMLVMQNKLSEGHTPITVDGVKGFMEDRTGYGNVYHVAVFPFEHHYVAIVFNMDLLLDGPGDEEGMQKGLANLKSGNISTEEKELLRQFDAMVRSLRFAN